MNPTRIVIVGGGFAGVKCARTLRKKLPRNTHEIVIFNRENHMVFHPLLAEVAGASINPAAVSAPLRQMLPGVRCRTEAVRSIDLERKEVVYESHDGRTCAMPYDHVVVACGAAVNLGMVPGMADHAFPLKTIGDAMALRAHVMQQMEKAEVCDDPERKRWYLSFVVVGGGFSGVEVAGELNDLVRKSRRFFLNIAEDDIRVTVIHSRDQLLPEITPALREYARGKMEKAGISVLLDARVALATAEGVGLGGGTMVRGATVVCMIGTAMPALVTSLEARKEAGRLLAESDMRLAGHADAWAIGDCARIVNAYDNRVSPPTGQFAERQGRQAAENIVRILKRQSTRPFSFKPLGQLCAIGGRNAVAEFMGVRMSGVVAWFFWRSVYLFKLPSWSRRCKAGFDWAWELFFRRDLAHIKADTSTRVAGAHYAAGDFIFRQGDPGTGFFIIEKGEVEVIRCEEGETAGRTLKVLGSGDFFGEMALLGDRMRSASIRARTAVEVVAVGKNVFSQISGSLKPLQNVLARSMKRRATHTWQRWPALAAVLAETPLPAFVEPAGDAWLKPDDTFEHAIEFFHHRSPGICGVIDEDGCLRGILARTDLFRAAENGAQRQTPIREIMVPPIAVALDDSSLIAASTMHDHEVKMLPVIASSHERRLVGYVRAERMILHALRMVP